MTRIRRINVSQIEGDNANNSSTNEIRPYGEIALYQGDNGKLELLIADGIRTNVKNKVLNKGTFFGGDADSSDQLNRDTIKLVPDEELRRNGSDQYLVIDPTFGDPIGHIHIRAGGAIDSSSADLFLGGEKNNVRVSDTTDSVTITTDFDGTNTRTWTFNNNGGLQLPGSSNGLIGESEPGLVIFSDSNFAVQTNANNLDSKSWIFGSDGNLSLPPGFIRSTQITGLNLASNYDVHILADYTDNNHEWIFEASTAELTVPGPIKSKTNQQTGTRITGLPFTLGAGADNGYVGIGAEWNAIVALGDLTGYTLTAQQTGSTIFTTTITQMRDNLGGQPAFQTADGLPGYSADITFTLTSPDYAPQTFNNLELAAGTNTWTFGANGILMFPNSALVDSSDSNIEFRGMNNFNVEAGGVVNIVTDSTDTAHSWQFGDNGAITFPDTTVQTTAWTGNQAVSTTSAVKFNTVESNILGKVTIGSTLYNIVTISLDTPFTNPLITVDQDLGPEFPDGQQIEITGVTTPGEVNGVWYVGFQSTRTFRIFDDIEQTDPPDASLWAGYTGGGIVKNLDVNNDLTLNVNGSEWSFDEFGNLTLPSTFEGYGDIKGPNGVSQLANRAEGSWTLPTGNIGVGFTVPTQGTYVMWVRGNIPNGIIVWNATATVTNDNVPVVGQQFAWVYTGGGTPLDFVSLPDQFVGTAGTIVRSNPGGITEANQFNFTIANLSGSSQTVAWGYVKI